MRIRLYLTTGMSGGRREEFIDIPEDEVAGMDEDQLEEHLQGYASDFMSNHIDYGYEVLDG